MNLTALLGMSMVCALGAMSPGPSLAVVLRNTISGGRTQGVLTGIGHGIGFTIYAFLAVTGLSAILIANESVFTLLQLSGALILLYLSYNMLTHEVSEESNEHQNRGYQGFTEGFMISFLNPKILVFLVAVFSQFIDPNMVFVDRIIMVIVAGLIDTVWYVLVATFLAGTSIIDNFRANSSLVDRIIGSVLLILALIIISKSLI